MNRLLSTLLRLSFLIVVAATSQSCATILNGRYTRINVKTTEAVKVVVNNDTLRSVENSTRITVPRQKDSLKIEVIGDTASKSVTIASRTSPTYYANFAFFYGLGALIEKKQPRRYTYPHIIYTDLNTARDTYATFDSSIIGSTYILNFTPVRLISLSNPSIEFSIEKSHNKRLSSQLMASYLIPSLFESTTYDFNWRTSGFRVALEEKFYLRKTSPKGLYVALEFNYLKTQYRDYAYFSNDLDFADSLYVSYLDTFNVQKQTFSFNLKYGYQMVKGPFTLDAYVGIGPRYKSVSHHNQINPEDVLERPRHPNFYFYTNQAGDFWTVSLTANFRVGWTLPDKKKGKPSKYHD